LSNDIDSSSVEEHCARKLPQNDNKYTDSVDFNSNAVVEPNREAATSNKFIAKDGSGPISSSPSSSRINVAASTDMELTSVAHMLDVASATNFRTLLAPSLTPPKTVSSTSTMSTKASVPDDADSVEAAGTVVEAANHRDKVHIFTDFFTPAN